MRYEHLVSVDLTDPEQAAALDEVGRVFVDMKDAGWEPTVGITTTPDGDVFSFEIDDRRLAS